MYVEIRRKEIVGIKKRKRKIGEKISHVKKQTMY